MKEIGGIIAAFGVALILSPFALFAILIALIGDNPGFVMTQIGVASLLIVSGLGLVIAGEAA